MDIYNLNNLSDIEMKTFLDSVAKAATRVAVVVDRLPSPSPSESPSLSPSLSPSISSSVSPSA